MNTEPLPQTTEQMYVQSNDPLSVIPPAVPVHKTKYAIYITIFVILLIVETVVCYFLFIKNPFQKPDALSIVPAVSLFPSPTPTLISCSDASCLMSPFLACEPSTLTMPFMEGSSFNVIVYGKENTLCRYSLTIVDTKTNNQVSSSECRVPMEKMTKDTLGHLFGQDKNPGQETVLAEQNALESQYCVKNQPSSNAPSIPSPQVSPTLSPPVSTASKKVTCASEDPNCIFTNIIDGFTNGCMPVEVTTTTGTEQVTLTISGGENGSCRFQMKGVGVDQDCLFVKENVKTDVIKGMMGMDNISKDPEFIKIKAASCK